MALKDNQEALDDGWLEKEVENIELNMSLEDAYRHIKSSYIHHMHERNAVFLPKAELIALMCIKQAVAESKEDKKIMDEYVSKSAVQQMLHEAYADDVLSTKDGCKALYKRLDDMPAADVQPVKRGRWVERAYDRKQCTYCGKCEDIATDFCPNCGADMQGE